MIYLAVPYTHDDPQIRLDRFNAANAMAARLMCLGQNIFLPISHSHPIVESISNKNDMNDKLYTWQYWKQYDFEMLRMCSGMYVLMFDGWKDSVGVTAEIEYAKELGIHVEYLDEGLIL